MTEAFICDAVRTPIGRYGGALSSVRTDELAAIPIRALMQRNAEETASYFCVPARQVMEVGTEVEV